MCTVSLMPLNIPLKSFVLTSNRDEMPDRVALPPQVYTEKGAKLLFPKDKESGGSWIGISEHCRLICLLNGGFEPHHRKSSYRISRGVVVKDFLTAENIDQILQEYDLENIEPFTIILVDWKTHLRFMELVWAGEQKHLRELELKEHFWSSTPLYNKDMRVQRENWFSNFLRKKKITPEDIWNFHHSGGIGDVENDFIMDRGFIKTQSITQIVNSENGTNMKFEDLQKQKISEKFFPAT